MALTVRSSTAHEPLNPPANPPPEFRRAAAHRRIDEADAQEFKLKRKLAEIFDLWCATRFLTDVHPQARKVAQ